jgi:hypothetical protein
VTDARLDAAGGRRQRGPFLLVGGAGLIAFVIALAAFGGDLSVGDGGSGTSIAAAAGSCGKGTADPTYSVAWTFDREPPPPGQVTIHLTLRHDGRTVTGARVCVVADMPDMPHSGTNSLAEEVPGGRYDAELNFSMGGDWAATVTIAEPGAAVVSVRVAFQVAGE